MSKMSAVTPECGEPRAKANAILDAAQRLFAAFGYRQTAMDDVARAAGVAKRTLYCYFDGKEAVFRAMHARTLADLSVLCDEAENAELLFPEKLYQLLDRQCGTVQDRYARSEHLMELAATRTTVGADLARDADAAYAARLVRVFQSAALRGEINIVGAGLSAESLVSTLLAATRVAKHGKDGQMELSVYRYRLRKSSRSPPPPSVRRLTQGPGRRRRRPCRRPTACGRQPRSPGPCVHIKTAGVIRLRILGVALRFQRWLPAKEDAKVMSAPPALHTQEAAANSSNQKPFFWSMSPSSSCEVKTITIHGRPPQ